MSVNISKIDGIIVSGFGLPVLSADYTSGSASSAGTITVQFIDEEGTYPEPSLSATSVTTVNLGGFTIDCHPVSYRISERTSGGKTLTVTFKDTSIILDRYFVGLYNQLGEQSEGNLIIVGSEEDPCDTNPPGGPTDPCSPCLDQDKEQVDWSIECQEIKDTTILPVSYNLDELLEKMPVAYAGNINSNEDYKKDYTGTLRNVLGNWCSDYGYTFYWEDGRIVFVDIRDGITIDDSDVDQTKIISKVYGKSIDNSLSRGSVVSFNSDGEIKEYDCSSEAGRKITCFSLRLDDILDINSSVMTYYGSYERLEGMIAMSMYTSDLRDNYVWYIKEGIDDPDAARLKIDEPIPLLGNLTIKKVLDPNSPSTAEQQGYETLFSELSTEEKKTFLEKDGYFILASVEEDLKAKYYEFESGLGNQFMGKYYVRSFNSTTNDDSLSFLAPDASVNYYGIRDAVQFDFIDLLPSSPSHFQSYLDSLTGTNFVVAERQTVWLPSSKASDELEKLSKDMNSYAMKEEGFQNIFIDDEDLTSDKVKFFMVFNKPDNFSIQSTPQATTHPTEADNVNIRVTAFGSETSYGLRTADTEAIRVKSASLPSGFDIYYPVQSSLGATNGGYTVLTANNRNTSTNVNLNKIQIRNQFDLTAGNTVAFDINLNDVTSNALSFLTSENPEACSFSIPNIRAAMDRVSEGLTFTSSDENEEKVYVLTGLPPENVGPSKGLNTLSVRLSVNGGIETTLSYGNKHVLPISQNILEHRLEERLQYNYRKTALPFKGKPPTSSNDLTSI